MLRTNDDVSQDNIFVALPTYNRGVDCTKVITYILSQNISNWYLFIVDDGSEEKHSNIITDFVEKINDNRIKYVKNSKNIKSPASLNVAINVFLDSNFSYFAWISDDNHYSLNYLKNLYDLKADFAHSAWHFGNTFFDTEYKSYEDIRNFRGLASYMWSKYAISTIGEYNEEYDLVCDLEYLYRTFYLIKNIKYSHHSEIIYVHHADAGSIKYRDRMLAQDRQLKMEFNPELL